MQTLTVSELTASLKSLLEGSFGEVFLQAEISNFKPHSSGHCYFVLKDPTAQIQAVMFRSKASLLKQLPQEGDAVLVKGQISVYEQRGQYQIIVSEIKPQGLGALLAKLEELKKVYAAKGYFALERKRAIPPFPERIGVITSPTGAVIQDILHILKRRAGRFSLLLNPVKVQGTGAALEIAAAIDQMNEHRLADVLIVGRGGGSIEDLWAFNEQPVIEAIFRSQIPVISAVGHETDTTLSDLVADLRAPTPSAAAEIVSKERVSLLDKLREAELRCHAFIQNSLSLRRQKMTQLIKHPFLKSSESLLSKRFMQIDESQIHADRLIESLLMRAKLALSHKSQHLQQLDPQKQLKAQQKALLRLFLTLDPRIRLLLAHRRSLLERHKSTLAALNPKKLLSQGYALLFTETSLVTSIKQLPSGTKVRAELADGTCSLTAHSQILF